MDITNFVFGLIFVIAGIKNLNDSRKIRNTGKQIYFLHEKLLLDSLKNDEEKFNERKATISTPDRIAMRMFSFRNFGFGLIILGIVMIASTFFE